MTGVTLVAIKASIFSQHPCLMSAIEKSAPDAVRKPTLRERFWPIESHEHKKLVPLILMMFLICFSYTLLRDLKDVMVLQIGTSESISYMKLGGVLPSSVIFMMIFTKLSIKNTKKFVFYSMLSIFMVVFGLILVLTFFGDHVHPEPGSLTKGVTGGLLPVLVLLEKWTVVPIYIFAEMYGTVCLSLLFWGFANDICTVNEARRFYPLISLFANVALVILMFVMVGLNDFVKNSKDLFCQISLVLVLVFGAMVAYIYNYMQKNVLTDPVLYNPDLLKPKKKKAKMGMIQSLKFVLSSGYVAKIAVIVVAYGMVINFLEIYYKNVIGLYWLASLVTAKGVESGLTGFMVIILSLSIGSTAVKRFGWTKTALVTPLIIGGLGIPFLGIEWYYKQPLMEMGSLFGSFKGVDGRKSISATYKFIKDKPEIVKEMIELKWLTESGEKIDGIKFPEKKQQTEQQKETMKKIADVIADELTGHESYSIVTPIYLFGFLAVVFAKSFKYSFFDPTKEMAYIPLDDEVRGKSKAAVDVVAARFGKSGASGIFVLFNTIINPNSLNYVYIILILFIIVFLSWMSSTVMLGREFNRLNQKKNEVQMTKV
ncbi:ADP/ATP carrier protein [Rozella allomycis CSF55]|uniref:ADP,ATP carrier protein n=1 Tax=Rozella allomycis (strain CSF55) TaxID=988480 RepID=A0A075B2H2_ROZAC|nr:ADP/ATP carrier protein domain-containing protein [Rozella allomycis CSF55]RKP20785.1 ADP/ATP carrier protein [Rozella allomycis CSF55]|eukprot:EPZ36557.1 ADP/ATP carrier protein domain-containing protein [Rozella allomycis CSF55]